jgi:hypothetical protein
MRNRSVVLGWWLVSLPLFVGGNSNNNEHPLVTKRRTIQNSSRRRRLRRQTNGKSAETKRRAEQQDGEDRSYVYDEVYGDSDVPIIRFPLVETRKKKKDDEAEENESDNLFRAPDDINNGIPACKAVKLEFQKAADGRELPAGTFVENEWSSNLGIKIKSTSREGGKNDVFPMIFDSFDVESNGLQNNDIFFLGSPNFECDGDGVGIGRGGKIGQLGENCEALGNLLVPTHRSAVSSNGRKKEKNSSDSENEGGVILFEFKKYTEVLKVGLLNVMEGSELHLVHNDGESEDSVELSSVGTNGYQVIDVGKRNVQKFFISFSSLAGVSFLDLCVDFDEEEKQEDDEVDK